MTYHVKVAGVDVTPVTMRTPPALEPNGMRAVLDVELVMV
jgi:hypothetical protein